MPRDQEKARERKRRFRAKRHAEKYGPDVGDQRGLHGKQPKGRQCHRWNDGRMIHRPDNLVKGELLDAIRADGYEPVMAFDDRTVCVNFWRACGIPCAQVADGNF